jgi:lactoylglutathione lyase
MRLAKPALDVGLYTNQLAPMLDFWQNRAQLELSEMLPLGGGVRQHRHVIEQSVLKLNHTREALDPSPPSGLAKLAIFVEGVEGPQILADPDGNALELRPRSFASPNLRLTLAVNDVARSRAFYGETLELPVDAEGFFRVGTSQIEIIQGQVAISEQKGLGYRYMTFQVFDVLAEHSLIVVRGGVEGVSPVRLGEVAYISFVRDPDGNWIEISQRKSITGSLA